MDVPATKPKRRSIWRHHDSLFARLLIGHVLLAASLTLVLMVVFYVERNQTLAAVLADHWAGALAQSAGLPGVSAAPLDVTRRDVLPTGIHLVSPYLPRAVALREGLAARGVHITDMAIQHLGDDTTVWLHVDSLSHGPMWLGISGPLVEHYGGGRIVLAVAVCGVLVLLVAWLLSRRIAIPLEQLSQRIRSGEPTAQAAIDGLPEIVAIDQAYGDLLDRLTQQDRERSLMLAGVSHDLRSPLGRIRLAAELLPDIPDVEIRRETIVRNVHAMDRLVGSFLDLIRVGELNVNEPVDLVSVVRHAATDYLHPGGDLTVDAPSVLILAQGNHLLLERVVANLLDNAFKHGRTPVQLKLRRIEDTAVLEVEDAGDGVDASQQAVLFDAFARGDSARTVPGLGLGLAIVSQGIRRMGGRIEFDSCPGRHIVRIQLFGLKSHD